jgi:hypothetical protein
MKSVPGHRAVQCHDHQSTTLSIVAERPPLAVATNTDVQRDLQGQSGTASGTGGTKAPFDACRNCRVVGFSTAFPHLVCGVVDPPSRPERLNACSPFVHPL